VVLLSVRVNLKYGRNKYNENWNGVTVHPNAINAGKDIKTSSVPVGEEPPRRHCRG